MMDDQSAPIANDQDDRLLDLALAGLAAACGPAPGFIDRVMGRLPMPSQAQTLRQFGRLLGEHGELRQQCSAIGSKAELAEWLRQTAATHQLDAGPLLASVDGDLVSANDGELDDQALDLVVGAGSPGAHYLANLLRILGDPV